MNRDEVGKLHFFMGLLEDACNESGFYPVVLKDDDLIRFENVDTDKKVEVHYHSGPCNDGSLYIEMVDGEATPKPTEEETTRMRALVRELDRQKLPADRVGRVCCNVLLRNLHGLHRASPEEVVDTIFRWAGNDGLDELQRVLR